MNCIAKSGKIKLAASTLTGVTLLLAQGAVVHAQQVQPQDSFLRPSLDGAADTTGTAQTTTNNSQTTSVRAPVQQTNAPLPIRLQSNQPQQRPLPPPPPPRPGPEADPFQPLGLRIGSFRAFPILEITGDGSDNVRTDHTGKKKDIGLRLAPSIRVESDWVRHSLTFNANSEHIFYAKAHDMDTNTFTTGSTLRLDIRRDTNLTSTATYQLSQTSSASSEVPGTAIGSRSDHELSFTSALTHRFNRAIATLTAGVDWLLYDNLKLVGGGKEDNADREYVEPSGTFRLGYEVSPAIIPFAQISYVPRIHKKTRDRNGIRRDSQGITGSTGIGFNLSPIWDGEVALVYEYRNFKDNSLDSINAVGLNATINWRPTQLTTVSFVSATNLDESSTAGISGTRNYDLALNLSHRFRDNLTGTLSFGLNYDDFVGTGNDDLYYTVNTGFAYTIRREMQWIANYQFTHFKSGTPGDSYTENRISTGIRFRL